MRWPLRLQILLPFAGLLLVVVALTSALDAYFAARRSEQQIEGQLRGIAKTLLGSSFPLTNAVLRQTAGLSGAEFAVTAPDGSIVAASFDVSEMPAVDHPVERWDQLRLGEHKLIGDHRYFHAAIALAGRTERSELGLLHIFYPEQVWRTARWQAIYPPLAVGLVAFFAVGGLAFALAARLSRPIQKLRSHVQQLAAGDFTQVSLPDRNDELRDLGESVNSLAAQLNELRRVIKRSERLSLLGQLSGGLAHQLRNDVTGARIAVQIHQRESGPEESETLTVALRQLTLAEQHLQQFLAAGQPRALARGWCDVRGIFDELVSLVRPMCNHHGVDLQLRLPEVDECTAIVDREQLRQSLLNLALNAIEAAGPGGWVRFDCEASSSDGSLRINFSDSGTGVSPDLESRLFEPFTTSKQEGIGLGLTVARQVAEAHGGTLRYRRDDATHFEISLPAGCARASQTHSTRMKLDRSQPLSVSL